MAFAKLKDTQLFYQLDGPEGAPVLVFSNSLGTTHRLWDPQVEAFSKDFRMLRYDSRGHGESSRDAGPLQHRTAGRRCFATVGHLKA